MTGESPVIWDTNACTFAQWASFGTAATGRMSTLASWQYPQPQQAVKADTKVILQVKLLSAQCIGDMAGADVALNPVSGRLSFGISRLILSIGWNPGQI